MTTRIYYDGDCPFCTRYVTLLRLRDAAGPVDLVDLRADPAARDRFAAQGMEPDAGMIVETGGRQWHGADAMHALSLMSGPSGPLNALAAAIFRHRLPALILYPLLRAGRNATLFALGRAPMRAADPAMSAAFDIFARFLGVFAVMHALIYTFRYAPGTIAPSAVLLLICGVGLILQPSSRRLFVVTVGVFAIGAWLQAPLGSNHTILKNFLILTILLAGAWHLLRGSGLERMFGDIRPVGQMLLLIMYAFGIFHKINTDFLNPETSCAVALWRQMPAPMVWIDTPAMHTLAIYGTFIAEGAIMLMLIAPRWRHWGICAGIGFHSLLALSGFAMYPAFSTLSIVLHTLFIAPAAALRITSGAAWQRLDARLRSPAGVTVLLLCIAVMALLALMRDYGTLALVWLTLMIWPLAIIACDGGASAEEARQGPYFWSPLLGLNLVALLFFLNAVAPYMGLKTAQSMNMFANLRLEGGVSNHLVFRSPPGPFTYLEELVTVREATGAPRLERLAQREGRAVVHYQFLSLLEEYPEAEVAFARGDTAYPLTSAASILALDGHILHPEWVRKFFHFRPVDLSLPLPCE